MTKRCFDFALTAASISLVTGFLALASSNCASDAAPLNSAATDDSAFMTLQDAVSSTEALGLDLYQKLSDHEPQKNCFISPASIAICLNMVADGAAGATRESMARALHLPHPNSNANASFQLLLKSLESSDAKVQVNIANALYVNDKAPLKPAYANDMSSFFQAQVHNENFSDNRGTTYKINSWCSEKTNGHIPKIVDVVATTDFAFLLDAIYFKGSWAVPFSLNATTDGEFLQSDGKLLKVRYMSQTGRFSYFAEKEFQAVHLPYGGNRFEAIVFLPQKGLKLDDFRKRITPSNWDKWMNQFELCKNSSLVLPRFHIDYASSLNDSLKLLGFEKMFSGKADFSKMHTPPPSFYISSVIHKTTLDVNEEGTVATAVTKAHAQYTTARRPPDKSFQMVVNRPFVFAIRDTQTGSLLFIGSVNKPENKVDMR